MRTWEPLSEFRLSMKFDIPDLRNSSHTVPPEKMPEPHPHPPTPYPNLLTTTMNCNTTSTTNNNNNNNNNNNYNNNNTNTMAYNDYNDDHSHSSNNSNATEAVLLPPARKHEPGTLSALYKLAARNLRESHGVPSMTALKLEKTVALLRLAPRRVVVQGLAPRRLLKGDSSPLILASEGSGRGEEELFETETGELAIADTTADALSNNSSCGSPEKGNDSATMNDNINSFNNNGGQTKGDVQVLEADDSRKARHPIHAALVAGGIDLRPGETRPLLRALGVRPHRLVRLGLVKREAIRSMPGRRGGGPGQRQPPGTGGPRMGGVGRPRGRPYGPSHGHGGWSMHGPPRPIDGDRHETIHLGGESMEEGAPAPLGPHGGPRHRGPHHQGGRLQGPPRGPAHLSMSAVRRGRGPPGVGKHGHRHGESEGEEGQGLDRAAPGSGQFGPRRRLAGGMCRPNGRPHGPFRGPFREGGASGGPPGVMAHAHHGSPSLAGGDMDQRGGRHEGMRICGGGGGGGHRQRGRMMHPAQFVGGHQPYQLEAY